MTNQNQNQTRAIERARLNDAVAQLRRLVEDALPSSTARRDKLGAWAALTELATGHTARDELFSGRSVVIRVATSKREGMLVTRASLEGYGYSTAGVPSFRLETEQRATGMAVHRQHLLTLRSHDFERWAAAAILYAADGGQV